MTADRRLEKTLKAHWKAAGSVALGSRAVFWPQGRGASLSDLVCMACNGKYPPPILKG